MTYQITSNQLVKLLGWAISSYQEHIDQHGKDEETAAACAIREVIDGMTAERELIEDGVNLEPSHAVVSEVQGMTTDMLLSQLQFRLDRVKALITMYADVGCNEEDWQRATGNLEALRGEQLWLASMIDDLTTLTITCEVGE